MKVKENGQVAQRHILRVVLFLKNNEWWIIGTCIIAILFLGWYGFANIQEEQAAGVYPQLDNLYRALQLFFLESGDRPNVTLPLQIARFFAPLLLAWASIKALWPVLKDSLSLVKLNSYKNHLVVCGIDRKGMEIVNGMAGHSGVQIVVIEKDKENENIESCEQRGIIVLAGNANDRFLLRKARVESARYLFAVTGDDSVNFSIAGKAFDLLRNTGRPDQIQCFSHVFDLRLRSLFEQHEIFANTYDQFNARIFNVYEESARFVLGKYAPERFFKYTGEPAHILIIGFGWTGESIAKHALRTAHYGTEEPTMITVIDRNANAKKKLFFGNYAGINPENPILEDVEMEFVEADIESVSSLAELNLSSSAPPSVVYVCLGSDTLGIFSAVKLRKLLNSSLSADANGTAAPIVVCLKEGDSALFESRNFNQMNDNIHGFNMVKFGCSKYFEAESDIDLLAKTVHSQYIVDCLSFSQGHFEDSVSIQEFFNAVAANKYTELLPELKALWLVIEADTALDAIAKSLKKLNALLRTSGFGSAFLERHPELKKRIQDEMAVRDQNRVGDFSTLNVFEKESVLRSNLSLLKMQFAACPDLTEKKTLGTWDELAEDIKDSNRYQADHIPVKLWIAGFNRGEEIDIEELSKRLSDPALLPKLAEVEHNRWAAEKKIAGWRFSGEREDTRKRHHLLIPFGQLPDNEKKKDCGSINNIPHLVSTGNWKNYQKLINRSDKKGISQCT